MASSMDVPLFILVVLVAAGVSSTAAEIVKVGGETGWTTLGSPNYTAWAASQTIYVDDLLLFTYNKEYHNVLEVTEADFKACNNGSALSKHTSGKDTIPIATAGHHFFICGQPGHCTKGQKVAILALHGHHESPAPAPGPEGPEPSASSPAATRIAAAGAAAAAFAFAFVGLWI